MCVCIYIYKYNIAYYYISYYTILPIQTPIARGAERTTPVATFVSDSISSVSGVYVYIYIYIYIHLSLYVYMYVNMYIYIYISCTYEYIYIYIYRGIVGLTLVTQCRISV